MSTQLEKGHELEDRIAEFFAVSGYAARTNVILEGRSGSKHEIDVLAEKSDGITTFIVAVECKAWATPIEKDVVTKLGYIVNDLGLSKGIIVSLNGWRSGAEQTARQLGIELWGRDQIEQRLGRVSLAHLDAPPAGVLANGLSPRVEPHQARALVEKEGRGRFGLGREQIVFIEPVWIPVHLFEVACSRLQKDRLRKASVKTVAHWNGYEAIQGQLAYQFAGVPELGDVTMQRRLTSRVKDSKIAGDIAKTFERYAKVVQDSAKERHARALNAMGIPTPIQAVSVESRRAIFLPVFVARLASNGGDRIVAVDAHGGSIHARIGAVLTAHMGYLMEALALA